MTSNIPTNVLEKSVPFESTPARPKEYEPALTRQEAQSSVTLSEKQNRDYSSVVSTKNNTQNTLLLVGKKTSPEENGPALPENVEVVQNVMQSQVCTSESVSQNTIVPLKETIFDEKNLPTLSEYPEVLPRSGKSFTTCVISPQNLHLPPDKTKVLENTPPSFTESTEALCSREPNQIISCRSNSQSTLLPLEEHDLAEEDSREQNQIISSRSNSQSTLLPLEEHDLAAENDSTIECKKDTHTTEQSHVTCDSILQSTDKSIGETVLTDKKCPNFTEPTEELDSVEMSHVITCENNTQSTLLPSSETILESDDNSVLCENTEVLVTGEQSQVVTCSEIPKSSPLPMQIEENDPGTTESNEVLYNREQNKISNCEQSKPLTHRETTVAEESESSVPKCTKALPNREPSNIAKCDSLPKKTQLPVTETVLAEENDPDLTEYPEVLRNGKDNQIVPCENISQNTLLPLRNTTVVKENAPISTTQAKHLYNNSNSKSQCEEGKQNNECETIFQTPVLPTEEKCTEPNSKNSTTLSGANTDVNNLVIAGKNALSPLQPLIGREAPTGVSSLSYVRVDHLFSKNHFCPESNEHSGIKVRSDFIDLSDKSVPKNRETENECGEHRVLEEILLPSEDVVQNLPLHKAQKKPSNNLEIHWKLITNEHHSDMHSMQKHINWFVAIDRGTCFMGLNKKSFKALVKMEAIIDSMLCNKFGQKYTAGLTSTEICASWPDLSCPVNLHRLADSPLYKYYSDTGTWRKWYIRNDPSEELHWQGIMIQRLIWGGLSRADKEEAKSCLLAFMSPVFPKSTKTILMELGRAFHIPLPVSMHAFSSILFIDLHLERKIDYCQVFVPATADSSVEFVKHPTKPRKNRIVQEKAANAKLIHGKNFPLAQPNTAKPVLLPETSHQSTSPVGPVESFRTSNIKNAKKTSISLSKSTVDAPYTNKLRKKKMDETNTEELKNGILCKREALMYDTDGNVMPYFLPLSKGWIREIVERRICPTKTFDIYYHPPKGCKLRSLKNIEQFLIESQFPDLKICNFTFLKKALGYGLPYEIVRKARECCIPKRKADDDTGSSSKKELKFKKKKKFKKLKTDITHSGNDVWENEVIDCFGDEINITNEVGEITGYENWLNKNKLVNNPKRKVDNKDSAIGIGSVIDLMGESIEDAIVDVEVVDDPDLGMISYDLTELSEKTSNSCIQKTDEDLFVDVEALNDPDIDTKSSNPTVLSGGKTASYVQMTKGPYMRNKYNKVRTAVFKPSDSTDKCMTKFSKASVKPIKHMKKKIENKKATSLPKQCSVTHSLHPSVSSLSTKNSTSLHTPVTLISALPQLPFSNSSLSCNVYTQKTPLCVSSAVSSPSLPSVTKVYAEQTPCIFSSVVSSPSVPSVTIAYAKQTPCTVSSAVLLPSVSSATHASVKPTSLTVSSDILSPSISSVAYLYAKEASRTVTSDVPSPFITTVTNAKATQAPYPISSAVSLHWITSKSDTVQSPLQISSTLQPARPVSSENSSRNKWLGIVEKYERRIKKKKNFPRVKTFTALSNKNETPKFTYYTGRTVFTGSSVMDESLINRLDLLADNVKYIYEHLAETMKPSECKVLMLNSKNSIGNSQTFTDGCKNATGNSKNPGGKRKISTTDIRNSTSNSKYSVGDSKKTTDDNKVGKIKVKSISQLAEPDSHVVKLKSCSELQEQAQVSWYRPVPQTPKKAYKICLD